MITYVMRECERRTVDSLLLPFLNNVKFGKGSHKNVIFFYKDPFY